MNVTVKYQAQARQAAGVAAEVVDLPPAATLPQLLLLLAERHGPPMRRLVSTGPGPRLPLLFFLGDEQVLPDATLPLRDGDVVTVLTPIAGG